MATINGVKTAASTATDVTDIKAVTDAMLVISGTSPNSGGTANTSTRIELDSNASAVDGAYDPAEIHITGGTGAGQARQIWQYDGAAKLAYVNRDWKVTPDDTSAYSIFYSSGNSHVNEGLAQAGGASTITLNALASAQNSLYLGQCIYLVAGTGADQARMCVGYNGATKVATVDSAWIVQPDNTTVYAMRAYPGFVHGVPAADSAANVLSRDVQGSKDDAASRAATASTIALLREALSVLGALDDAGSLVADTSTLVALSRKAAKEAWEVEHHFHNGDFGFGAAAVPSGETHIADRVGTGAAGAEAAPFVLDGGNDDWGAWTQVIGSSDTPIAEVASATHYDMNEMTVVATEHSDQRYMWQAVVQEDAPADDPVNGDYATENEFFIHDAAVQGDPVLPTRTFRSFRRPVGTKMWMRLRAPDQNTSTASFYLYGHYYIDPE